MQSRNLYCARITLLFFFALSLVAYPAFADMKSLNPSCNIIFVGEIDKSSTATIVKQYEQIKRENKCRYSPVTLFLNSTGGDVDAAIAAGDFIRHNNIETIVDENDSCASACVLTFLGGVKRNAFGRIGLHRPYSSALSASEPESRRSYDRVNSKVSQYLVRMNIPVGILNAMNAVPPIEIKWIHPQLVNDDDHKQLIELHIIGTDPVSDDQKDSAEAKKIGISKQEYYSRIQRAKAICPDPFYDSYGNPYSSAGREDRRKQYGQCYWDVMYGRR